MSHNFKQILRTGYLGFIHQRRNNFSRLTIAYKQTLNKRPLLVQAIQSGLLMGAGDFIAQTLFEGKISLKELNFIRTVQFFVIGFVVVV